MDLAPTAQAGQGPRPGDPGPARCPASGAWNILSDRPHTRPQNKSQQISKTLHYMYVFYERSTMEPEIDDKGNFRNYINTWKVNNIFVIQ